MSNNDVKFVKARKFPKGSEILMMGINIPDMILIAKEHGLLLVPIDYDLETMAPCNLDDVKTLTTDKVSIIFTYTCYRLSVSCLHTSSVLNSISSRSYPSFVKEELTFWKIVLSPSLGLKTLTEPMVQP